MLLTETHSLSQAFTPAHAHVHTLAYSPAFKIHMFSLKKSAPSFPVQQKTHWVCMNHATWVEGLSGHSEI